jgi:hypothetical protein
MIDNLRRPTVPHIEVDDHVYEQLAAYARRWRQTEGEALATLIRLYVQPVHTVTPPPAPTGDDPGSPVGARP